MKRIDIARLALTEVREKHAREIERAAQPPTPATPDPQIEDIGAFLKSRPFGCQTDSVRKFSEKILGKKIPRTYATKGKANRLGRLRLGVVTANATGHPYANDTIVLSLDRNGHVVTVIPATSAADGNPASPARVENQGMIIERREVRKLTAEEASAFLAQFDDALTAQLGDIIASMKIAEICEAPATE